MGNPDIRNIAETFQEVSNCATIVFTLEDCDNDEDYTTFIEYCENPIRERERRARGQRQREDAARGQREDARGQRRR